MAQDQNDLVKPSMMSVTESHAHNDEEDDKVSNGEGRRWGQDYA